MKDITIACPPNSWPNDFAGCLAIGVTKAHENESLWLVFHVNQGVVVLVSGLLLEGEEMPPEVERLEPIIHASAEKNIWTMINKDKHKFYNMVANGKLHIGGDFREFGRLASHLVRLSEQTGLWTRLDEIVDEVRR